MKVELVGEEGIGRGVYHSKKVIGLFHGRVNFHNTYFHYYFYSCFYVTKLVPFISLSLDSFVYLVLLMKILIV